MNISISNITIENKLYCVDNQRYNCNDKYVRLNKTYDFKISESLYLYYKLEYVIKHYLEEIANEYCNDILDIATDDINIYALITIQSEYDKKCYWGEYNIQFDELKYKRI